MLGVTKLNQAEKERLSPRLILMGMTLLALAEPIVILYNFGDYGSSLMVIAPIWMLSNQLMLEPIGPSSSFGFSLNPLFIVSLVPVVIVRFLYVYWVYQFYLDKTSMKCALIIGIIAEIQAPIFMILTLAPPGVILGFVPFTLPIVLIVGYLLMIRKKPSPSVEWLEEVEGE